MKFVKLFLFSLCLLVSSAAFAQPAYVSWNYIDWGGGYYPPIGVGCDVTGRVPYPDGTTICIFWDNNANGPDAADVQPEIGTGYAQANFNCDVFNGEGEGYGRGYFAWLQMFNIELPISELGDTALYYLRISAPAAQGGDTCCWLTRSFLLHPGYQEIWALGADSVGKPSDWTCAPGPCGGGGTLPDPPTNCTASDDVGCLSVTVTWQHPGGAAGFNIYRDGVFVQSTPPGASSWSIPVPAQSAYEFCVKAFNGAGESEGACCDEGSSYLLRFVDGASGNVTGWGNHGQERTLYFDRPTEDCNSMVYLVMVDLLTGARHDTVGVESLVTEMTFTLPDRDTDSVGYRMLMEARHYETGVVVTDTTDSTFYLRPYSAVDYRELVMPDRFDLGQNYPNPFNPQTEIVFSVPVPADVRICIYNITGQLVRTLTQARYSSGVHRLTWDGTSDVGSMVAAGVYLYRMEGPNFAMTKKMLLIR